MVTAPVLQRLTALASNSSSEWPVPKFLSALTDLFLHQPAPSPQASSFFTDIAAFSLDQMLDTEKVQYTERVAANDKLPHDLALKLATDPCVEVAGLVLAVPGSDRRGCRATCRDAGPVGLARLAGRQGTHGKAAVDTSRRSGGDAGEPDDNQAYAGNSGSNGPRNNQKSDILSEVPVTAGSNRRDGASVSSRAGIPARIASVQTECAGRWAQGAYCRDRCGRAAVDDVVAGLASQDKAFDLARVLGALGSLSEEVILEDLLETEIEPIMAACRSAGVGREGFPPSPACGPPV